MSWLRYQRWWLDFRLPAAKLALFRVVFFALLGLDAFLQIQHAPRYGAGDFNVSHLPWLDGLLPAPSRSGMLILFLTQAYLAFLAVFGVAARVVVPLLAALYGYGYFVSQLNSYQHHYLIFLVLVILSLLPWRQLEAAAADGGDAKGEPTGEAGVTSWALRLLFVQVALVYLWAAVSKLDGAWIDGSTLALQVSKDWARAAIERLGGFSTAAVLVLVAEIFLAVALLWRRLWPAALVVGVGFHAGVELAGFHIGLFSYFMFGFYLLLVPDRWLEAAAGRWRGARPARLRQWTPSRGVGLGARAAMLVASLLVALAMPFDERVTVALLTAVAGAGLIAFELRRGGSRRRTVRIAVAHVVACLAIIGLEAGTEQSFNYHKFWAGSARRLGVPDEARAAYEVLSRDYPAYGPGHYHLGRLQRQAGDEAAALASFERAQRHGPDDYRAFLEAALLHHRAGRGPETVAAAERVIELRPRDARHLQLAERLVEQWKPKP